MTARELIAWLIAEDPRRDYLIRHMAESMMAGARPDAARMELSEIYRLMIVPGFNGWRKSIIEGESWQAIKDEAANYMESGRRETL